MNDIGRIYDHERPEPVPSSTAPLSNPQIKSVVEEVVTSLLSKGVSWNEILSAMEEMAFDQGNQSIADVLGAAAYHAWQTEAE